jgi:photosystem II stability/assembly factor-like uncharacterized protein
MFWRLEKMFWVGAISMVVVFSSIMIARADTAVAMSQQSEKVQQTAQVWSGWVGKIEKSGSRYTLSVGEPAAHVYTLDGNAAEFEKFVGTLVKVQGDLNGTTLKVTKVESAGRVTKADPAGAGAWTRLGPEGTIEALAVDPKDSSILYAGTNGGKVYKSTDGGKNWKSVDLMSSFKIMDLVINPNDSNTIYAGTGRGVFRSRDGGQNWTLVNSGLTYPTVKALAIDPKDSSTLYAGTWGNGVFKNTRREVEWNELNTGLNRPFIYALAVDKNNPSFVYAGTPNGVLKSMDGGMTWSAVTPQPAPTNISALVIAPEDSNKLYAAANNWIPQKGYASSLLKSTDGGKTWSTVDSGLPQNQLRALAVNPADPSTLYVGTETGVFHSSDGGATWSEMNTGLTSKDVFALAVDPVNPNKLYAGTASGVFEIVFAR